MTDRVKGRASASPFVAQEIARQARRLPAGSRVLHRGGRHGTIRMDNPQHVPGIHCGKSTAWCLTDMQATDILVCVAWDNDASLTWLVWVSAQSLIPISASLVNRPSLATKGR